MHFHQAFDGDESYNKDERLRQNVKSQGHNMTSIL